MMRQEFIAAVRSNQAAFDLDLSDEVIEQLAGYYELVQQHNPILHLVGPCPADEFATRHVLESLTLLKHLPMNGRFVDVGPGAGLPSVPCLIARDDLRSVLIESKEKKVNFLRLVRKEFGLEKRVEIVSRQLSETSPSDAQYVVCRALDKFVDKLPQLLKWAGKRNLLLFGGPGLEAALEKAGRRYTGHLLPQSARRYLFHVNSARDSSPRAPF